MPRRSNEQIMADLTKEGTELLSKAYDLSTSLTQTYRRFAEVVVDLRKRFPNTAGTGPDWKGTTQAYRDHIAAMYRASGVPEDAVSNMQAAIRYHIGNVLRDRLSEEELTEAGLSKDSPLDRARASRSGGTSPEDEAEWFDDTVETLLSIADEHRDEIVLVDLRDENGTLPMVNEALRLIQVAHERGVTEDTASAVGAVLDQVLAEAAAFRATVQATAPPVTGDGTSQGSRPEGDCRCQVAPPQHDREPGPSAPAFAVPGITRSDH
jgi:hypothetical protein